MQVLESAHNFLATHPLHGVKPTGSTASTFADAETEAVAIAWASLLSSTGRGRATGGLLITRVNISRLRNFLFESCYEQPLLFCSS